LHRHPELSGQEHATSQVIQEKLEEHGIPFTAGYAKTGVLGIVEGDRTGRTVALRADMDALPLQEENDHDFVSENEGVMHCSAVTTRTRRCWWGLACC
jgi:metal-dependent amidase/aminoacylase/carboxypeptidase family protein